MFKSILSAFLCLFIAQHAQCQTFSPKADTVNANVYFCPSGNVMDSITNNTSSTVYLHWHIVATNFPADWQTGTALQIVDNWNAYSNVTGNLWNGTSGQTHISPYPANSTYLFGFIGNLSGTTTAGTYWLEIQLTDTVASYTKNIWLFIHRVPGNLQADSGTITGNSTVCMGSTTTLLDNGASGGAWTASNSHAMVSGGVVSGVSAGIDTIMYTVTNSCSDTSVAKKVITVLSHQVTAGSITGNSTVCVGSSIILNDTVSGGTWSAVNTHAGLVADTITGVSPGVDTILYTVFNACNDSAVASKLVTVLSHQVSAGFISGDSAVCVGAAISLLDTVTGGYWNAVNGNATVSAGNVRGIAAGWDTIVYTNTNSCGDTAVVTKAIRVNSNSFISTQPANQSGSVGAAAKFYIVDTGIISTRQWQENSGTGWVSLSSAGPYSGVLTDTLTISPLAISLNNNLYRCIVESAVGCLDTSASATLNVVPAVVNEFPNSVYARIFPNPVTDYLNISCSEKVRVKIFDLLGTCVIDVPGPGKTNVSALSPGFYIVRIYDERSQLAYQGKIIKN